MSASRRKHDPDFKAKVAPTARRRDGAGAGGPFWSSSALDLCVKKALVNPALKVIVGRA